MALYVAMIVSFCFPHVVDVSVLSICIALRAFVVVIYIIIIIMYLYSASIQLPAQEHFYE